MREDKLTKYVLAPNAIEHIDEYSGDSEFVLPMLPDRILGKALFHDDRTLKGTDVGNVCFVSETITGLGYQGAGGHLPVQ